MYPFTSNIATNVAAGNLPDYDGKSMQILANQGDVVITYAGQSITLLNGMQINLVLSHRASEYSVDNACGIIVYR